MALEPDPVQAAANQARPRVDNVEFVQGLAGGIPWEDSSADVVIFCKSLHHVPVETMADAIRDAARVLKKGEGILFIVEPDMRGEFSQLVKPFHDETWVRHQALQVLDHTAAPIFGTCREYWYTSVYNFSSFAVFLDRMTGSTFNTIESKKVDTDIVRKAFQKGSNSRGYTFNNLMRVRLYEGPVTTA